MKNNKVKGFTLIELIVVVAIFGIIMFGALQLIPPVTKMMVQSTLHEEGNAAVSSISNYLEGELSAAEYMIISNSVPDDDARNDLVKEFVLSYYEGVLRNGSSADAPTYGDGRVHVMVIDNDQNGKISNYTYNVKFDVPNKETSAIVPADFIVGSPDVVEWAVNRAYYDSYDFTIRAGVYEDDTEDGTKFDDPDTYEGLVNNLSAANTCFTIEAATNRPRNGQIYSFRTTSSMALTNLHHRNGKGVSNTYFVVDQLRKPVGGLMTIENTISDITKVGDGSELPLSMYSAETTNSRHYGYVATGSKVYYSPTPVGNGYCFVYSYGSEIDIQ